MSANTISKIHLFQAYSDAKRLPDVEVMATEYESTASTKSESSASLCSNLQQQLVSNADTDYTKTLLYKAYRPLMFSLQLMGWHHHRRVLKDSDNNCGIPTASQVYSWIVTIICWLLLARSAAVFRNVTEVGPIMLGCLSSAIWLLLCTLNATAFLKASHQPENEQKFFRGFAKLSRFGGAFVCPIKTRKYIIMGTIVMWTIALINFAIVSYLVFGTQFFDMQTSDPFTADDGLPFLVLKGVYCLCMFYLMTVWIFPSALQLSMSILIYKEFSLFRESFRSKMSKDKKYLGNSLELDRRRFMKMLRIVEAADGCLSLHQSAAFVCNICNICVLLYNIIYYPSFAKNPVVASVFVFWIFYGVADICVVILSGVLVNSSVSYLLSSLLFPQF